MVDQQEVQRRLQNIIQQARAGNLDAKYAMAVITSRQDVKASMEWMRQAIDGGHLGALYTLGAWYIQGAILDQDLEEGHKLLRKAQEKGFADADMMLASLHANGVGVPRDWKAGLEIILKKAKEGNSRALSQLAFLCFMKKDTADLGDKLLRAAAERYDILAAYAYAKRVLKSGKGDQGFAKTLMALAAQRGRHPLAMKTPGIMGEPIPQDLPKPTFEVGDLDWKRLENLFPEPPKPPKVEPKVLSKNPYIATFPGFLTPEEADYLIGMAVRHLHPSQVVDPVSGGYIQDQYRTSSDMRFWPTLQDLVVFSFLARISEASGEPQINQEMLGVLKYEPGQEYKPHGDFLTADFSGKNPEVERSGQRKKTFLVYLNEDFTGGETEFTNIDLRTRGKKGDGLMFINVTEKNEPNTLTIHAGRPVREGIKWLSTMWIREKEYKSR